ncbi:MAG: electron transport complex subunit RsxG [Pasteurellales bacterium]|nr:MAG: electron transport complex subunit RsxG [Pasteurellales bacterium]
MNTSKISIRYALILATVALCCTSFSTLIYLATKDQIDYVVTKQQRKFLKGVIPTDLIDNDIVSTCKRIEMPEYPFLNQIYIAKKANKVTAYVIKSTAPDGYSGAITILQAFSAEGRELETKVLGVRVLDHRETPGLGDKFNPRVSDWIYSFNNKFFNLENENKWFVKKDGGEFDQFTGATITPRAIVNNVRYTAKWLITQLKPQSKMIEFYPDCDSNKKHKKRSVKKSGR